MIREAHRNQYSIRSGLILRRESIQIEYLYLLTWLKRKKLMKVTQ